jgi:hypothetical protein
MICHGKNTMHINSHGTWISINIIHSVCLCIYICVHELTWIILEILWLYTSKHENLWIFICKFGCTLNASLFSLWHLGFHTASFGAVFWVVTTRECWGAFLPAEVTTCRKSWFFEWVHSEDWRIYSTSSQVESLQLQWPTSDPTAHQLKWPSITGTVTLRQSGCFRFDPGCGFLPQTGGAAVSRSEHGGLTPKIAVGRLS